MERATADLLGNAAGHFILQEEYIAEVAFIALGPEMPFGGEGNQLRGDTDPITRP